MVDEKINLANAMYHTECFFCGESSNDCMLMMDSYPIVKTFICGNCRKLGRKFDGTKYFIVQENVRTPGGRILEPKERYVEFTESPSKKSKQNKSKKEEPYVEPD